LSPKRRADSVWKWHSRLGAARTFRSPSRWKRGRALAGEVSLSLERRANPARAWRSRPGPVHALLDIRHRACSGRCVSGPLASCEAIIRAPPTHRAHDGFIFVTKSLRFRPSRQIVCPNTRSGEGTSVDPPLSPALARPRSPLAPMAKTGHEGPKTGQEGRKTLQKGSQSPTDRAKTPKTAPRRLQKPPRRPKRPPRGLPRRTRAAKIGPFPSENKHF